MLDTAWQFMQQGQYQQAIEEFTVRIQQEPRMDPHYANRALTYLALREYAAAARDWAAVIGLRPNTVGGYLGLGVSLWCQRQPFEAIEVWRRGLGTGYTDAAGGVVVPALLLYAALRTQNAGLEKEALGLLRKHARHKRLLNWPGALVPYLLGKIDEEQFRAAAALPVPPHGELNERHHCQASFYIGVRGLFDHNTEAFQRGMRECAQSWNGLLEQEYYLATWEVEHGFLTLG